MAAMLPLLLAVCLGQAAAFVPRPDVYKLLPATPHPAMKQAAMRPAAATVSPDAQRVLVLALTVCNETAAEFGYPIDASDMRAPVLKEWDSVAATWQYCSSGRLLLNRTDSVFVDVDVGCAHGRIPKRYNATYCSSAYDQQVSAYLSLGLSLVEARGFLPRDFGFVTGAFPEWGCPWAGYAYVGGIRSMFFSPYMRDTSLLMHEMGHSLGLWHAAAVPSLIDPQLLQQYGGTAETLENREYGDWSSMMGSGVETPRCFNLFQQELLGWHSPRQLDATSLPPGKWLKLTLPDTFADPTGGIRINPTWRADIYSPSVYISYVPALGSNRGLHPRFADKVYVHLPFDSWNSKAADSMLVGKLSPGERWSSEMLMDWENELVVHFHYSGGPVGGKLLAAVSICRPGGTMTCTMGTTAGVHIKTFPLQSAAGKFALSRGKDWQLEAKPGQWYRHYRVEMPEECGRACFYLPTCRYFTYLASGWYKTGTGLKENCYLVSGDAERAATPATDAGVTSGHVLRAGASPPPAPPPPLPHPGAGMVPVRLYGGGDPMQGRLEVFWKNKWGTVCDDYVTEAQVATVVCRQLGYGPGRAVLDFGEAFNHSGAEVVWWTLRCGGGEASVHDCQWNYDPNCDHSEDVGVVCSVAPPPSPPPPPAPARPRIESFELVGSASGAEGRLEVVVGGRRGTVCNDGFTQETVSVICRQLGLPAGSLTGWAEYGSPVGQQVLLADLACNGSEAFLAQCPFSLDPACGHTEDVAIRCTELPPPPAPPAPPPAPLTRVRLAGGPDASEGRLEAEVGGMWGTVCDDEWGPINAKVVCRQLGYSQGGQVFRLPSSYGASRLPIVLDDVSCAGGEPGLSFCAYATAHDCSHEEDVGVRCTVTPRPPPPRPRPPKPPPPRPRPPPPKPKPPPPRPKPRPPPPTPRPPPPRPKPPPRPR